MSKKSENFGKPPKLYFSTLQNSPTPLNHPTDVQIRLSGQEWVASHTMFLITLLKCR